MKNNDADKLKRRQALKKYTVFALMFLVFAGCIWFIFAPSEESKKEQERQAGFNSELPDPKNAAIEGDKIAAYEQEAMRRKKDEKMQTLDEFTAAHSVPETALPGNTPSDNIAPDVVVVDDATGQSVAEHRSGSRGSSFASSHSAYRQINETLGSFYEQPAEDPEKEALKAEVEQLRLAAAQQGAQPGYAEQVALLEKSYELAAKYMTGKDGATADSQAERTATTRSGKAKAVPVGRVSVPVVSSLPQSVDDSEWMERLAEPRNMGFNTATESDAPAPKNTISACVHGDQTVVSGQGVRLRLLEPMRIGSQVLPRNTLLTGECRIQGERLRIEILQVEHEGTIIPVELTVHDTDGQPGVFIPGSMEAGAAKEMAANLGQNLGTSISITNQSAGDQLLSELGKGAIQGVSQYIAKKMREEKVRLKAGYRLMLYQNDN